MEDISSLNKYLYNCSECSSNIEIISLDENKINFKCNNNHKINIEVKEYLEKMKNFNNMKLNYNKCNIHNEEYKSYCFECNIHLCDKCLMTGEHGYHYKIFFIEMLPKNEVINEFKNVIQNNKANINSLKNDKIEKENLLNNLLNENIKKIKEIIKKNKEKDKKKEKEELELNDNKYKLELKKLKEEYENKLKKLKLNYNNNLINIKNKYKIKIDKNESIYNSKIYELNRKKELMINK